MNLTQMLTRTRIYVDDRESDRYTDTELTGLLNAAQEEVQKEIDQADENYFSACQTYSVVTSANTSYEFDLPSDFKKLILAERKVDNGDPIPATWTRIQDRHDTWSDYSDSPICYLRGNKLGVVEPATDYTLRVWYTKRIPDLSAGTDTSEIPVEYHDLVCKYAARFMFMAENRDISKDFEGEFNQAMGRLLRHIEKRQKQTSRTVRIVEDD